ncbi:MAG: GNAT family N-acetyltransferase [Bacillota bacterium]|nr:GNAT family N-acetyltransferase [Bacillota bacterium]
MRIEYLCENKQYIDTVVKWIYNEFIKGIRPGISYERVESGFWQRGKEALPITIVVVEDKTCIGAASLVVNDLKPREYTPWLAGLYVDKEYRNKGIGKVLIKEIEAIAHRFGYDTLYLRTEHASGYYRKIGWSFVEKLIDEFGLETSVFIKRL